MGLDVQRTWSERELRAFVREEMDATSAPQLAYLSDSMRRLLGDDEASHVPEPLRRKGILVDIKEQGQKTAETLQTFAAEQREHNTVTDGRMASLEKSHRWLRRWIAAICRWIVQRGEQGSLLWHRLAAVAGVGIAFIQVVRVWAPVVARKTVTFWHSIHLF